MNILRVLSRCAALALVVGCVVPAWGQFAYPDFSSVAGINMVGVAAQSGNRLRVVRGMGFSLGAAWRATPVSVQSGFQTDFQFQITNPAGGSPGGNGFTFTIQNQGPTAIGDGTPKPYDMAYDGITNSLSVEFDMYPNPAPDPRADPDGNHVSIHTRGVLPNSIYEQYSLGSATPAFNMSDARVHTVRIAYYGGGHLLAVYLDDLTTPLVSVGVDLTDINGGSILQNGKAWLGFTAGTGGAVANHDILNWNFLPLALPSQAYFIPDIGAAGMNTYVEIIGRAGNDGQFGSDGFLLNDPGDPVRVVCANPADSNSITVGPLVVGWNGKQISTQIFVHDGVQPNSDDWSQLAPAFRIPLSVMLGGFAVMTDTFYIVRPHAVITGASGTFGAGGVSGIRSRRGAMLVDSIHVSGPWTISTADCDPGTPGNQAYLPCVMLSRGAVTFDAGASISADARLSNGGPGGGGGGGMFAEGVAGTLTQGGDGFTGGEGGTLIGGTGTGGIGRADSSNGGWSLNGVPGGWENALPSPLYAGQHAGSQGTGGGTGFCFGTSGRGGYSTFCSSNTCVGGFGAGSGAGECKSTSIPTNPTGYGGGGGGFTNAGTSTTSGGGFPYGNAMLVPLTGGSGGAGGNEVYGESGLGGGGGGSLALYGRTGVTVPLAEATGANGGNVLLQYLTMYSGAGGGGSGGALAGMSNMHVHVQFANVKGGDGGLAGALNPMWSISPKQNGGAGSSGRWRADGPVDVAAFVAPADASQFIGPSTDTSSFVPRDFILTGTSNGQSVNIYLKPEFDVWRLAATIPPGNPAWSQRLQLPGCSGVYYLVAAQAVPSPASGRMVAEPAWVLSQAAANVLHVGPLVQIDTPAFAMLTCDTTEDATVEIRNVCGGSLVIDSLFFARNAGFTIVPMPPLPIVVQSGSSATLHVRFISRTPGTVLDTLIARTTNSVAPRLAIPLVATRDTTRTLSATPPGFQPLTCDSTEDGVLTLQNGCSNPVTITAVDFIVNTEGFSFRPAPTVPFVIPADSVYRILVHFAPQSAGKKSAVIAIHTAASTLNVALASSRDSIATDVVPHRIDFGVHTPATLPAADSVMIHNRGDVPISIRIATPEYGGPFFLRTALPLGIAPGDSAAIVFLFFDFGRDSAFVDTMFLESFPGCANLSVPVAGERRTPSAPPVIDSRVTLATQLLCESDRTDTLVLHNLGQSALRIDSLTFTSPGKSYAVVASFTLPVSIAPRDSLPLPIRFQPSAVPARIVDTLRVWNSDTLRSPWNVALSGIKDSVGLNATPRVIDFGVQCAGATLDTVLTIVNVGTVRVGAVASASGGTTVLPSAAAVDSGATLVVRVHVPSPLPSPAMLDTVRITDSTCGRTALVVLKAQVLAPALTVTNAVLGTHCVAVDAVVTLANPSAVDLVVDDITTSDPRFTLVRTVLPIQIKAGQSAIVVVRYLPTDNTPVSATLTATGFPCGVAATGTLAGTSSPLSLTVGVPQLRATQGDSVFVPISAVSPELNVLVGERVHVFVSYDHTRLVFVRAEGGAATVIAPGHLDYTSDGATAAGTLGTLVFIAADKDSAGAAVQIDSVVWANCGLIVTQTSGVVVIDPACGLQGVQVKFGGMTLLAQNAPNPFATETAIIYQLPQDEPVRLVVSDILGRTVSVLADGLQTHGTHTETFVARSVPPGMYNLTLRTSEGVWRRMMTLSR